MEKDTTKSLGKVIRIDESEIRGHLDKMVRGTVEETLNALLDAEADDLCQAQRYERSADRVDTRAGHYKRKLHTQAGEVELKMPKLRRQTFETAIIERYRRRDISIEEAIVQMYLAGVSVRRVEDITEALWGTRVSSGTVSNLNKKVYKHIERWRNQALEGDYPYVYLDGVNAGAQCPRFAGIRCPLIVDSGSLRIAGPVKQFPPLALQAWISCRAVRLFVFP